MDIEYYAVVTGGTRGIGKEIVRDLLTRGYTVITNYAYDEEAASESLKEFRLISHKIMVVRADQSDADQLASFTELVINEVPHLDCLILNSGTTLKKDIELISNQEWEKVLSVNLNSHFYLVRDFKAKFSQEGKIVFIGSLLAEYPHALSIAYGVSKAAVHALAQNLVKFLDDKKIRVNVLAPGFVETEMQRDKPQSIRQSIQDKTALKRFATVEEVSHACMFLLENPYINGAVLSLDGGYCYQ